MAAHPHPTTLQTRYDLRAATYFLFSLGTAALAAGAVKPWSASMAILASQHAHTDSNALNVRVRRRRARAYSLQRVTSAKPWRCSQFHQPGAGAAHMQALGAQTRTLN
jgi:hypothetical protein